MTRHYHVHGANGYWLVSYTKKGTGSLYGTVSPIPTKKLAIQVADALSNAYADGRRDAAEGAFG